MKLVHQTVIAALALALSSAEAMKYKNVVYFINWGIYQRKFHIWDMDWSKITHVNYAFAQPNADGTIKLFDKWADTDKKWPEQGDSWNDPADYLHGCLGHAFKHKLKNRGTKFGLSLGGWTLSDKFSGIASTAQGRSTFVKSSIQLMEDLGLDFIDLDWEYPVEGGNDDPPVPHRPDDIDNFILLLKEYKQEFKKLHWRAELTAATPAGPNKYRHWKMPEICGLLDLVNIMTYDFAGSWSNYSDHSSNLYADPTKPANGDKFLIDTAIKDYIKMGCAPEKIILGIPLYGHSFEKTEGMYKPYSAPTEGSWLPGGEGWYDYKALPLPGCVEEYREDLGASFCYDKNAKKWISYDETRSMKQKLNYVKDMGLGGTMFWEASGDKSGSDSLISMAYDFYGKDNMDFSENCIGYPNSKHGNVRDQGPTPSPTTPKPTTPKPTTPKPTTPKPTTPKPTTPKPTTPAPTTGEPTDAPTPGPTSGDDCECSIGHCDDGMCKNCNYVKGNIRACFKNWSKEQCTEKGFNWCGM